MMHFHSLAQISQSKIHHTKLHVWKISIKPNSSIVYVDHRQVLSQTHTHKMFITTTDFTYVEQYSETGNSTNSTMGQVGF